MLCAIASRRRSKPDTLPAFDMRPAHADGQRGAEGDQWLHEMKSDGYRMHARLNRGAVKLLARAGLPPV